MAKVLAVAWSNAKSISGQVSIEMGFDETISAHDRTAHSSVLLWTPNFPSLPGSGKDL